MATVMDRVLERVEKGEKAKKNAEALIELAKEVGINVAKQETELMQYETQLDKYKAALKKRQ